MRIVAWVSLLSRNKGLTKWFLMQCIKGASTLRFHLKGISHVQGLYIAMESKTVKLLNFYVTENLSITLLGGLLNKITKIIELYGEKWRNLNLNP